MFNKRAYIRMCFLELSKVLIYKFYYSYNKNKYGNDSRLLFTETFNFSNYSTKSKYYDDSM